jgi:hypothetical protein
VFRVIVYVIKLEVFSLKVRVASGRDVGVADTDG